jgi:hypothetical protein
MPASGCRVTLFSLAVRGPLFFLVRSAVSANDPPNTPRSHALPHPQTGHWDARPLSQPSSIRIASWIQTVSFLMEPQALRLRLSSPVSPREQDLACTSINSPERCTLARGLLMMVNNDPSFWRELGMVALCRLDNSPAGINCGASHLAVTSPCRIARSPHLPPRITGRTGLTSCSLPDYSEGPYRPLLGRCSSATSPYRGWRRW